MLWLYNIAIQLYSLLIRIISPFNTKASFFVKGRENIFDKIEKQIKSGTPHIWFHFASLGEFEQGRPVLERLKEVYPNKKIVVTFFSPSGYETRKNYALAAGVFYLPLDTATNAKRFLSAINPEVAIFTKYEYWYHYFKALHQQNIPLLIISGIFRQNQIFFKPYGSFNRKILSYVTHFFVQNEESVQLLASLGLSNATLSGDTRFDRVAQNAMSARKLNLVEKFCNDAPTFIAGSTWPEDERLIARLVAQHPTWKFIIAPHEIGVNHINEISRTFPGAVKYSTLATADDLNTSDSQVLIIDNIGMLSALYGYGQVAYIGGGFGAGIHNTLEAAAFGLPVIFGPKYDKFQEAKDMISLGVAKSINNQNELESAFIAFAQTAGIGDITKNYVRSKTGSTEQIIQHLAGYLRQ